MSFESGDSEVYWSRHSTLMSSSARANASTSSHGATSRRVIKPSPNEEILLRQREEETKRKERILQVRRNEKEKAAKRIKEFKRKKASGKNTSDPRLNVIPHLDDTIKALLASARQPPAATTTSSLYPRKVLDCYSELGEKENGGLNLGNQSRLNETKPSVRDILCEGESANGYEAAKIYTRIKMANEENEEQNRESKKAAEEELKKHRFEKAMRQLHQERAKEQREIQRRAEVREASMKQERARAAKLLKQQKENMRLINDKFSGTGLLSTHAVVSTDTLAAKNSSKARSAGGNNALGRKGKSSGNVSAILTNDKDKYANTYFHRSCRSPTLLKSEKQEDLADGQEQENESVEYPGRCTNAAVAAQLVQQEQEKAEEERKERLKERLARAEIRFKKACLNMQKENMQKTLVKELSNIDKKQCEKKKKDLVEEIKDLRKANSRKHDPVVKQDVLERVFESTFMADMEEMRLREADYHSEILESPVKMQIHDHSRKEKNIAKEPQSPTHVKFDTGSHLLFGEESNSMKTPKAKEFVPEPKKAPNSPPILKAEEYNEKVMQNTDKADESSTVIPSSVDRLAKGSTTPQNIKIAPAPKKIPSPAPSKPISFHDEEETQDFDHSSTGLFGDIETSPTSDTKLQELLDKIRSEQKKVSKRMEDLDEVLKTGANEIPLYGSEKTSQAQQPPGSVTNQVMSVDEFRQALKFDATEPDMNLSISTANSSAFGLAYDDDENLKNISSSNPFRDLEKQLQYNVEPNPASRSASEEEAPASMNSQPFLISQGLGLGVLDRNTGGFDTGSKTSEDNFSLTDTVASSAHGLESNENNPLAHQVFKFERPEMPRTEIERKRAKQVEEYNETLREERNSFANAGSESENFTRNSPSKVTFKLQSGKLEMPDSSFQSESNTNMSSSVNEGELETGTVLLLEDSGEQKELPGPVLQDAFQAKMSKFIDRSRKRVKQIIEHKLTDPSTTKARSTKSTSPSSVPSSSKLSPGQTHIGGQSPPEGLLRKGRDPRAKKLTPKEIKEINQRSYSRLPEVVAAEREKKRQEQERQNRERAKLFQEKLKRRLHSQKKKKYQT
eukprot:Nk52_evm17s227 gene=Nk52_evmTU17s227